MERKQKYNQNQRYNNISNDFNSFSTVFLDSSFSIIDSFDSNSYMFSEYGYISLYMNKSPASSTPLFRDRCPETLFSLNRLPITDSGRDLKNFAKNRLPKVENQENLGCNYISKCTMTIVGCNELRRVLVEKNRSVKEMIIRKVMADLPILMVHQIGYEFAKTVFNSCDEMQMSKVLASVVIENQLRFVHICNDNYGYQHLLLICLIILFRFLAFD